eukprot:Opistho-1_new@77683
MAPMPERYVACMVLGAAGDAIGYKNGKWEFTKDGRTIHKQCEALGGVRNLRPEKENFRVSDDTVMSLASAEAMLMPHANNEELYENFAEKYIKCMDDMDYRAPGNTTVSSISTIERAPRGERWCALDYQERGGGCGAAMRSLPMGLRYWRKEDLPQLVAVCIESGRITHHAPTGYLGGVAAAAFAAYAIQGVPLIQWGQKLLDEVIPVAREHVRVAERDVQKNLNAFGYFVSAWEKYLTLRGIRKGEGEPQFPAAYGVDERDAFYKSVSFSGWGGSSGHDAPMIAYDALLGAKGSWEELVKRGVLHGGDNDSTAILCCGWYGAMHGFEGVPECNHATIEYRDRCVDMATKLYQAAGHAGN